MQGRGVLRRERRELPVDVERVPVGRLVLRDRLLIQRLGLRRCSLGQRVGERPEGLSERAGAGPELRARRSQAESARRGIGLVRRDGCLVLEDERERREDLLVLRMADEVGAVGGYRVGAASVALERLREIRESGLVTRSLGDSLL